jgi:predicted alpha/beta superfamily hydrolase
MMRKSAHFTVLVAFLMLARGAAGENPPSIAGDVRSFTLQSRFLDDAREIRIALPRDYDRSDDRYPVLYVLDADWHLLPAVAAVRMLAETSYIQSHRIPDLIVVGIARGDRNRDCTPTRCESQHGMSFPTSGGADTFHRFLEEELIPAVDSRFRTHPHRILAGWSLGGLFAMHALLEWPDIFNGYIAISPSLWWDGRLLVDRAEELARSGAVRDRDLVLTIGTSEEGGLCFEAVQDLVQRWREVPLPGLRMSFLEIPGEDHNHGPYKAYFDGLRTIFADWFFPEAAFEGGLETLESHYAALSGRYGHPVGIPDHLFVALARSYLAEERFTEALDVVEAECAQNPGSAMSRFHLGEIRRQAHDPAGARDAYRRAMELELGQDAPDSVFINYVEGVLAGLDAPADGPSSSTGTGAEPYGSFPALHGAYLGQPPPGDVPVPFASGILEPEAGYHSAIVFNPGGDEAYWTEMGGRTFVSRRVGDRWSDPVLLPFDTAYGVGEPMVSSDDRRLYFLSRRPLPEDPVERERIWFVERTGHGWSSPRVIDAIITAHPTHWQFSFTADGDLYFTSEIEGTGGGQDIYTAARRGDTWEEPRSVGAGVNTGVREFCPFVAPDETYLIFSRSVPEERNRSDLFISFRGSEGVWSEAVNMGDVVNSLHNETSAVVTPDGRFLFFLRVSGDVNGVYWVSTRVIDALRPRGAGG